jgi:cytosine/adenosine deaminase-related metal-dependent hydrolase
LIAAGATLLLSTDGGLVSSNTSSSSFWRSFAPPPEHDCSFNLGEGHFLWLQAVEEKGMRPQEALMAATRNVARAYKVDKDLGTIEAGKFADLVVLDKDPLLSAHHYRNIHLVMKEGAIVNREGLPARRLLTSAT